jgi:hypothetical protein
MLKIAPFAVGLLTVLSIAPSSQAMSSAIAQPQQLQQSNGELAQISIIIGGRTEYYRDYGHYRREAERRRIEREREREYRRRYHGRGHHDRGYYDRDGYSDRGHHGRRYDRDGYYERGHYYRY